MNENIFAKILSTVKNTRTNENFIYSIMIKETV